MFKAIKQVRAAVSMLNADEVRDRATRPVRFGLVAAGNRAYAEMQEALVLDTSRADWEEPGSVHRAADTDAPSTVDIVLYEHRLGCPEGSFVFHREEPARTVTEILHEKEDLALALARQFPSFRKPVVDRIVNAVALENALFAMATALPDVIPNLIELPWAVGEFASDTVFLTANQIRMAFSIAAASGREIGFRNQKAEVLSIGAGAFGWRALARELVGHIPLGGGLIPKGAIAYAATFAIGKGLEYLYHANVPYTREEHAEIYRQAFEQGREVARDTLRTHFPEINPEPPRAEAGD